MTNWALLLARLTLAACCLPGAIARLLNPSGFAALLATKGMPYPQAVAAFCVVAEAFGPVAVALGFAPRFAASVLIGSLVITTATFHRFWEFAGAARQPEQAMFIGGFAMVAGLVFYAVSGPGDWSWQALWNRGTSSKKKQQRSRSAGPRASGRQEAAQPT